jgi:hypothetical protein
MHSVSTLNRAIDGLTEEQQARLFTIVHNNAELFNKVMPNMPLIQLILTGGSTDVVHPIVDIYNSVKPNE